MEYLWRWYNKEHQWEALERCLKTVSFPFADEEPERNEQERLITEEGMEEGEEEVGEHIGEPVNGIVNIQLKNKSCLQNYCNI